MLMFNTNRQFFYDSYFKTSGFCSTWPIGSQSFLGDLFKIVPGEFNKLGNIYTDLPGFSPHPITMEFPAVPYKWEFMNGLRINYSGPHVQDYREDVQVPPDFPELKLQFGTPGSYFYQSDSVTISRIADFDKLAPKLVKEMCSESFSFESLYIITEIAHISPFTFLSSQEASAELLLKVPHFTGYMPLDMNAIGTDYSTLYSRGLGQVHIFSKGGNLFFRAQKLTLKQSKRDELIRAFYEQSPPESKIYMQNVIDEALLELIDKQEIDPMNVNDYFDFTPMTMDDVAIFLGDSDKFFY